MTRAVIFDLDNCLSAADEPGQQLLAAAFDAIHTLHELKPLLASRA